jgi:hypothetical protein
MKIRDEISKILTKEIEICDEFLERTNITTQAVPDVQRKKDEAIAQLESINNIPDDLLEEVGPDIKLKHEKEKEKLENTIPKLPQIDLRILRVNLVSNTTSSSTDIVSSALMHDRPETILFNYFRPLTSLADNEDRKNIIIDTFTKLKPHLGDYIKKAQETAMSARGGVAPIDLACQHLRSSIGKVWGEVVDFARKECDSLPNIHYQLKKDSHRKYISRCLGSNENNIESIDSLLHSLSDLYNELSPSSKNPFINDKQFFEEVTTRWNLHLYNLSQSLGLN